MTMSRWLRAVLFDWGHTIIHETADAHLDLLKRPIHLMPDVETVLPQIGLPMGIWANTRTPGPGIREWLARAGVSNYFEWVVTSEDLGIRKPHTQYFARALEACGLERHEVLFVGNQLNTDILGAHDYGIASVWLSGAAHRSRDDAPTPAEVRPTYVIEGLGELPQLVQALLQGAIC